MGEQLKLEPGDEAECAAKFLLYESYASEVVQMRETLLKFHAETRPTVPAAIASSMDKEVTGIDSPESMGIFDDAREWFVYHMMRKAEKNNMKMAYLRWLREEVVISRVERSDRVSRVPRGFHIGR